MGYIGHAIGLFFWGVMVLTRGIEEGRTSDHSSFITTGCRVQATRQNTTKSPCLGRCSNVPLAATWYVEAKKRAAPSPHTNLDPMGQRWPGGVWA